ncbi:tigger transposable element-derived protein 2-like isoform X1 [Hylaeus anthracinus]|uniref:tigger transposable element-derived protein 2-like isoform X1 n=1 Tax=Hylaeus anthracinus TaxID=313031 RepID=UPI0023B96182|nr:tigger transposable element-derived protein 2-like isoform X1 [Hylaeus anthracinus]
MKMASNNENNRKSALSVEQRLEIMQQLDSGAAITRVAAKYDVHPATVRRIRRNAGAVCQLVEQGVETRRRKNLRKPANEELDTRLYAWFLEQRTLGDRITDLILLEKAIELNKEFGGPSTFKASRGWLWNFKNRHGIRLSNYFSENGDANATATQQLFVEDFTRRLVQEGIEYENIYKMEETGLMWKALPTRTLQSEEKEAEETKLAMDRVSIGLCVNVTGTHKLVPLFIHKYKNPRAFKHCKDRLPVVFKSQSQVWMNQEIFTDWYLNHFKPAVRMHQSMTSSCGKVILLLDNYREYNLPKEIQQDDHFEIIFLQANITPLLQPMNHGVIEETKRSYRCKMLRKVMNYPDGVQQFYSDYDLKDCIDLLFEAWTEISVTYIQNTWRNIIKQIPEEVLIKEEPGDPLEPNLQDIISVIIGEQASEESVNDFLLKCMEAENNFFEDEGIGEDEDEDALNGDNGMSLLLDTQTEDDEMKRIFANLITWSKEEPDFIKLHVKYLKDYYEQK